MAGEFTESSLNQMRSEGFRLLYFSIEAIENAFASQGVHSHWDEDTSEEELQSKIEQMEALSKEQLQLIGDSLILHREEQWLDFQQCLRNALERMIESILITSLFGVSKKFSNIQDACNYIVSDEKVSSFTKDTFYGYKIIVTYSNGDKIDMEFKEQQHALTRLRQLI